MAEEENWERRVIEKLATEGLREACLEALKLDRKAVRAFAERFSWRACAEDFVRNLQPYPEPEKTRFWRRLRRLAEGKAAWLQPVAWIPVALLLLVLVAVLVWLPVRSTIIGRTIFAIGSNDSAAYMSGLPIAGAKLAAFTLAGFFAAVGGLFLAIQTSSGNADIPQAGAYTLNSIAAVVIGGTSLLGGTGSPIGSIFGALVLRVISFNFRIFDVAPLLQPLVEGVVLLAAVSLGALPMLRVKNTLELFR